jgi:hypothetical protein
LSPQRTDDPYLPHGLSVRAAACMSCAQRSHATRPCQAPPTPPSHEHPSLTQAHPSLPPPTWSSSLLFSPLPKLWRKQLILPPNPPHLTGVRRRTTTGCRQQVSPLPHPPIPRRRPRRRPPPSFFIFFPKYSMDELDSISSNAALRQQPTHFSCSPHRR